MLSAKDIPQYTDGDSVTVELPAGWSALITVRPDEDCEPPWKMGDGHGPVSEWGRRDKRPGERVLMEDGARGQYRHGRRLFYDFAEAVRIAKRDKWGCPHGAMGIAHPNGARVASCAADADFKFLRAYCNGDWEYLWIKVTVRDAVGEEVDTDSIGGVEGTGDWWRECAAGMINGICAGLIMPAPGSVETARTDAL